MVTINKPLITVIIPSLNRHELLLKSIRSVFSQEGIKRRTKIIVVDEASTPPLNKFLQNRLSKTEWNRVKVIRNNRALGPSLARTIGLKYANSPYIAFLDSDDFWMKNFLQLCLTRLNKNDKDIITTSGRPIFWGSIPFLTKLNYLSVSYARYLVLLTIYFLNDKRLPYSLLYFLRLSSMVFTRRAIGKAKFVMAYRTAEDWKFIWDCIKLNKPSIYILPRQLVQFSYSYQSESIRRKHYWGYYYKLIDELPKKIRQSFGIRLFKKYTDLSVNLNHSKKHLHYYPKTD